MKHTIYLGLGTNMGDRLANLASARSALALNIDILDVSPIYETVPWGYQAQPDFLNQVLKGVTDLEPIALLTFLKSIEQGLGRLPTFRNGPRPIDIDILFFDDLILKEGRLELPHPRIDERAFVLVPLADIAMDFIHPCLGKTISELLDAVDRSGVRCFDSPEDYPEAEA
jgi:2-amino-4-hydroxy-6-hydroxymethyldihydropteridine diphosphokinase